MIKNLSPVIGLALLACISCVVLFGIFMWFVYWIEDKPKSLKATLWVLGFASLLSLLIFVGRTRTPYNTLVDVPIGMLTVAIFIYSAWGVTTGYMWWKDEHDSISDAELFASSLPGTKVESKSSEDVGPTDSSRVLPADKQEMKGNLTMMNHETFKTIITQMQEDSLATLLEKNSGYSNADPLHNFRQAAKLKGETTIKAIGGMMAKHTVSIYDLINKASEEYVPEEVWFEKIQDHMNYLLFLWAAVEETKIDRNSLVVDFEETPEGLLEYKDKPDLNSDEALKELNRKLSASKIKASPTSKKPDLNSDADLAELRRKLIFTEDEEVVAIEYKDEPTSKKPDLNSDADLAELRRKLIFTEDDCEPPTSVMINKTSQE